MQANNKIYFWRTSPTLKTSATTENSRNTCGLNSSNCTRISELYNLGAEVYLGTPDSPTTSTISTGGYADIRSLPPVF
jgi:hypothetical protein